jgi:hypothetical protein
MPALCLNEKIIQKIKIPDIQCVNELDFKLFLFLNLKSNVLIHLGHDSNDWNDGGSSEERGDCQAENV